MVIAPPSQGMVCPVRYEPAREDRKMVNPAASSIRPQRFMGKLAVTCRSCSSVAKSGAVHLRLERSGRDDVDVDVLVHEVARELRGKLAETRLRGNVRVVHEATRLQAVDRRDVDDGRPFVGARRGADLRQKLLDQEEGTLDVEVDHPVPSLLREVVDRQAPSEPGVVDQGCAGRPRARGRRPRVPRNRRCRGCRPVSPCSPHARAKTAPPPHRRRPCAR